jgi:hypothetical protein
MTYKNLLALLCATAALAGCGKDAVQELTAPELEGARIKFFNFGVGAPMVNFYANHTKMTAIGQATCATLTDANRERCTTIGDEHTNGVGFGGVGVGGLYARIVPGQYELSGRISAATDKDLAIAKLGVTLAEGKAYSFYMSGSYDATNKEVDSFVVEDAFVPERVHDVAYVRFVNAIYNANPTALVAVHPETSAETALGGEIAYKSGGAFIALPGGLYDLVARVSGTDNEIKREGVSLANGRIYTISFRGDLMVETGTNAPFLDNTTNR